VRHLVRIAQTFEAGHTLPSVPSCAKDHGHSWVLGIVYEVEPATADQTEAAKRLLEGLITELNGKNLNDQLPASVPSTTGVAAWAFERLDMVLNGLVQTECELVFAEKAICER
jgi:6-pyruvoyl-tetrahydropterin synthase